MFFLRSLFFSLLLTTSVMAEAKEVKTNFNLSYVFEQVMKNNKIIKAAEKDVSSSFIDVDIARTGFRPSISSGVSCAFKGDKNWNVDHERKEIRQEKPNKFSDSRNTSAYCSVRYNIFRGGADKAAVEEANSVSRAKKSEFEATKQKVLCEVASLYFEVIAEKREIQYLKSLLRSREESLGVATEMYKTGVEKYVGVMQAKAACAETESKLAKAEAQYKSICAAFNEATGLEVPDYMVVPLKLFDVNMKESQMKDLALKQNPKIIASSDKLKAAKVSLKKPNGSMYPSVDLSYSMERDFSTLTNRNFDKNALNHTVGISLTVPIYDGGRGEAGRRKLVEYISKTAVEHEQAKESVVSDVVGILASIEAYGKTIKSAEVAVETRELALHDTEEEYKAGIKIMNDVLEAQEKLFEAQSIEVQAQKSYFVSQCKALELIGKLSLEYLQKKSVNSIY